MGFNFENYDAIIKKDHKKCKLCNSVEKYVIAVLPRLIEQHNKSLKKKYHL